MKRLPRLQRELRDSVQRDAAGAGSSGERARDELRDEQAATELRLRRRVRGIVPLEPDERIRSLLFQGECVVAIRRGASFDRRKCPRDGDAGPGVDLYVTTHRLVILGPVRLEYPLAEIREVDVADGAVRLVVGRNRALELCVPDPRVLRVEIAAVREAFRTSAALDASSTSGGQDPVR